MIMEKCLVTRIVRDSILDGPGCRYVIFVKGCNLRCPWCHNPETQKLCQEILLYDKFCIHCNECIKVVSKDQNEFSKIKTSCKIPLKIKTNVADVRYHKAVELCPTEAISFAAKELSTDWLIKDILNFKTVYKETDGGVTISGGEPLLVEKFSYDMFKKAKGKNLNTAIDTSGTLPWKILKYMADVVDLWLYDLKHYDDKTLKTELAVSNFNKLCRMGARIRIRIPVIPGYNDKVKTIKNIASIIEINKESIEGVDLLPFHPFADAKYEALKETYKFKDIPELDGNKLIVYKKLFSFLPEEKVIIGRKLVHG
ncbi:MAG TPA: glycyl-radical enzyme activating protein [Victivallales bacterium]|nr:glycyl-radical enzyme activating protein [Victivallales bacterium]